MEDFDYILKDYKIVVKTNIESKRAQTDHRLRKMERLQGIPDRRIRRKKRKETMKEL